MRTLYGALGLPPRAGEAEIKAAFRRLAKQCHPDLNAGDKRAEQRFKEINEAHAILSDPGARERYDASLTRERSLRRLRLRNSTGIMAASFVLTVMVISTPILWRQYESGQLLSAHSPWIKPPANRDNRAVANLEESAALAEGGQSTIARPSAERLAEAAPAAPRSPVDGTLAEPPSTGLREATSVHQESGSDVRPKETDRPAQTGMDVEQAARSDDGRIAMPGGGKSAGAPSQTEAAALEGGSREEKTDAAVVRPLRTDAANWASYRSARFGFSLGYPVDIFAADLAQSDENVRRFVSRDGRAVLHIFATPNLAGRTLSQYRTALIQERYAKATFDYAPQRDTWFVLSGAAAEDVFYERVTFSCDRRLFHGWRLVFPSSERLLYEAIIEEMHRKYRHGNGPGARCGAVKRQVSAGPKSSGGTIDGSL